MNVFIDFVNSLPRYLTFLIYSNFSFPMYITDISKFIQSRWLIQRLNIEFMYSVSKKWLPF